MQKLLNVKNTVIESYNFHNDVDGITHLRIKARPNAWHQDDCPFCGRRHLPRYDRPAKKNKIWRGLDFSGIIVEIEAATHRVICPEHGVPGMLKYPHPTSQSKVECPKYGLIRKESGISYPQGCQKNPKCRQKIAVNLDFAGLTACLYLIRLKFLFSVPLRRLRFDGHSIF